MIQNLTSYEMISLGGLAVIAVLLMIIILRGRGGGANTAMDDVSESLQHMGQRFDLIKERQDDLQRLLQDELARSRAEMDAKQAQARKEIGESLADLNEAQEARLNRVSETIRVMGAENAEMQTKFRDTFDKRMESLSTENSKKLDEMRQTVDEKLQSSLEKRFRENFKTVSERLEAVHKGLGDMQSLATGVGDLKRVLTNVKTRGGYGEVQLKAIIEDFLTPEQYIENYDCGHESGGKRVEFGIRMPGHERGLYLPVDSKFPMESYERLQQAFDDDNRDVIKREKASLESSIKKFAKDIREKYIKPPHTADVAILFVPTEGLYAEIARTAGLIDFIHQNYKVILAGPTNFRSILITFKMGFQKMAIEESAHDISDVLSAVKTEFETYQSALDSIAKNLNSGLGHVNKLSTRRNVMLRALKDVEGMSDDEATKLLGFDPD